MMTCSGVQAEWCMNRCQKVWTVDSRRVLDGSKGDNMSETQSSDAVELQRVCALLQQGRNQFFAGDYTSAEKTFLELKRTAIEDAARNCARIHLGTTFEIQNTPYTYRDAEENRVNKAWLVRAALEFEGVLSDNATVEQREHAETRLAAIYKLREME